MLEREVKLGASVDFELPDLAGVLPGATAKALPSRRLRAAYWDTPDLRLARSGVTLRRRSGEGGPVRWTVKLPASPGRNELLSRREVNFDGEASSVPADAVRLLRAHIRGDPLRQVVELDSLRKSLELYDEHGRRVAEIDDDDVSVLQGSQVRSRFREVEVELAEDASSSVATAVVERLRRAGASDTKPLAKVVRALKDIGASPDGLPAQPHAQEVSPDAPAGELVRAALAGSFAKLLLHDPGVRLGEDPEDVHQARVATRRTRSYLKTMSMLLDPEWERSLRAELGWIADLLGRVRDADVLVQALWSDVAELPGADVEAAGQLLGMLADSRAKDLEQLWDAMDTHRYVLLLERLADASREPVLSDRAERPASKVAPALVARAWKRLATTVDSIGPEPDDAALHRVRILAKRCRYAADVAALVAGAQARHFARTVARVQDNLGELHDAVVAEAWLRDAARELDSSGAVVAGELISARRALAERRRNEWPQVWKQVSRKSLRRWMR